MWPLYVHLAQTPEKYFPIGKSSDWGIIPFLTEQSIKFIAFGWDLSIHKFSCAAPCWASRNLAVKCQDLASPHWKIILPSLWLISGAASAYSNLQDLHWPVLGGTKSKMWAEGWRESLQPSCHTDLHMQLPLPTQLESSLSWFLTAWTGRRGSEWHLCFPVFRVCINEICRLAKQS